LGRVAEPVVPTVAFLGDFGEVLVRGFGLAGVSALFKLGEQAAVGVLPEEVAGVEVGLLPGFFGGLGELPVVEAGAEFAGDGLVLSGAVVVAEAVVGEAEGLGEEPAFAVVLAHEGLGAGFDVAGCGFDVALKVGEGDLSQDGVAKFGRLVSGDSPEAGGIEAVLVGRQGPDARCRQVGVV